MEVQEENPHPSPSPFGSGKPDCHDRARETEVQAGDRRETVHKAPSRLPGSLGTKPTEEEAGRVALMVIQTRRPESNRLPSDYESDALPMSYRPALLCRPLSCRWAGSLRDALRDRTTEKLLSRRCSRVLWARKTRPDIERHPTGPTRPGYIHIITEPEMAPNPRSHDRCATAR